jgi:hypothetical protein
MFIDLSCDLSRGRFVELTWSGCAMIFWSAGCWLFQVWVGYVMFRHFLRSSFTQHERGLDRYGAVSLFYIYYIYNTHLYLQHLYS